MIHEEICTYEVCKLAKEKGFDVHPPMYFHSGVKSDLREVGSKGANPNNIPHSPHISCPTQTQLQRWLREEKNIVVVVDWFSIEQKYYWRVYDTSKDDMFASFMPSAKSMSRYDTWEQALESGLKYALKELK